ncbi:hypothetical protein AMATHDRAFT_151102 [Amanita thiersii Skay4041]|uniref:rRNA methyltransferase 2, mitochondrial n=1 Tax=Amanita thiersii Skay4041 TaxID=703135 RepID=A0A2A9NEW1_9AGAR|nr:hypothetical protein AMATHDRAFT_151102 [Amanita thiersii Skay4041]
MLFRPSRVALSKQKSSSWIARQQRDPYVKQRVLHPIHYRSRSAFKLLEIHNQFGRFLTQPDVRAVVDLGAAPGGWSQVVAGMFGYLHDADDTVEQEDTFDPLNIDDYDIHLTGNDSQGLAKRTVVAVDLLRMEPIPGVDFLQADFLSPQTGNAIQQMLQRAEAGSDGKVDVILSDMAANASGNDTRDIESSLRICNAVFEFSQRHLRSAESVGRRNGGVLLMKHFVDPSLQQFRRECLEPAFNDVRYVKPQSSRSESREGFFLCRGWRGLTI